MNRKEVVQKLIGLLVEIQNEVGEEIEQIKEATRPIGGIGCFDSLRGVVLTVRCIEKFEIKDDGKLVSLFEGKKNGIPFALTVGEIADRIVSLTK